MSTEGVATHTNMDMVRKAYEDALARKENRNSGGGGGGGDINWLQLKSGANNLRLLPMPSGMPGFAVHRFVAKNMPDASSHLCVERTYPDAKVVCPIMAVLRDLKQKGFQINTKHYPRSKYWFNAVDRADPEMKVWLVGLTISVYDDIMLNWGNPRIGDITDPLTGRDVTITKTGSGLDTRYHVALLDREPLNADNDIVQKLLTMVREPKSVFKLPNEEIMAKIKESADLLMAWYMNRGVGSPPAKSAPSAPAVIVPKTPEERGSPKDHPRAAFVSTMIGKSQDTLTWEDIDRVTSMIPDQSVGASTPAPTTTPTPTPVAPAGAQTTSAPAPVSSTGTPSPAPAPATSTDVKKPVDAVRVLGLSRRADVTVKSAPDCFGQYEVVRSSYPRVCQLCPWENKCKVLQ